MNSGIVRWVAQGAFLIALGAILGCSQPAVEAPDPAADSAACRDVVLTTGLGEIVVAVDLERAPVTAANFLRYVDERLFEGARFYRSVTSENQPDSPVKIAVIQGGLELDDGPLPEIRHETTEETGLRHLDGCLSMAREEPGSASSEIFICVGDQPELDFGGKRNPDGQGFSAFGQVIDGMDVVRAIHRSPVEEQSLTPPIKILSVARSESCR